MSLTYYRGRKKRIRYKLWLGVSLVCILVVGGLYFFYQSPLFSFKTITVVDSRGADHSELLGLMRDYVESKWWSHFLPANHMLAWLFIKKLPLPIFESVDVVKKYSESSLSFVITEYQRVGLWCFQKAQECFWFNRDGLLFQEAPVSEGALFLKIQDVERDPSDQIKIDPQLITSIESINEIFTGAQKGVDSITYLYSKRELQMKLVAGQEFIIGVKKIPPATFYTYLKNFLATTNLDSIDYVDFSVENRIFVKKK